MESGRCKEVDPKYYPSKFDVPKIFEDNGILGVNLPNITHEVLRDDFGITFWGIRDVILTAISELLKSNRTLYHNFVGTQELHETLLKPEEWNKFEAEIQTMIKMEMEEISKTPGNYFSFKTKDEISNYQTEMVGFTFPCATNDVLKVDMLFGERFSTFPRKEEKIFSTIQPKNLSSIVIYGRMVI
jgi:hypothetical protein